MTTIALNGVGFYPPNPAKMCIIIGMGIPFQHTWWYYLFQHYKASWDCDHIGDYWHRLDDIFLPHRESQMTPEPSSVLPYCFEEILSFYRITSLAFQGFIQSWLNLKHSAP